MRSLFSFSYVAAIFATPGDSAIFFSFFFPFLIEKSIPARAWDSPAGDGAVRQTLAESRVLGGAPRLPR